jgi:antitoxin CcdA
LCPPDDAQILCACHLWESSWTRHCTTQIGPIEQAKAAGIPLSQTLEEALLNKLKAKREAAWRRENQDAIAAYNERIAEQDCFSDEFRRF